MAERPDAALDMLEGVNGNAYDATTNPLGMAAGGHRQNAPGLWNSTTIAANYVEELAGEVEEVQTDLNALIAATTTTFNTLVSDAEDAATLAGDSEDKAEQWANEAEDVEVEPGLYSGLHYAAKAAQSAEDAALFDPASYYTKTEADGLLEDKADAVDVYSRTHIDTALASLKLSAAAYALAFRR